MHIEETRSFARTNYNEKTRKINNKSFFFFCPESAVKEGPYGIVKKKR
jgi:hypothetical protein